MTDSLVPLLLTILLALVTATSMLVLSWLLGRPARSIVDKSPYECGITPLDPVERHRFSVKFFIIAMLFVVFDVEVAFLYPWAVAFDDLGMLGFLEMMLFIYFLVIGFIYAWRKGAFEWR